MNAEQTIANAIDQLLRARSFQQNEIDKVRSEWKENGFDEDQLDWVHQCEAVVKSYNFALELLGHKD